MTERLTFLPPEPIKILNEPRDESDEELETTHNSASQTTQANKRLKFSSVKVSDCTIVTGDNGDRFAVWKITVFVASRYGPNPPTSSSPTNIPIGSPQIQTYKRYSDFVAFRNSIMNKLGDRMEIPSLPPGVPWYDSWKYQDVNFDKKWLAKRRRGLERFLEQVLLDRELVLLAKNEIRTFLGL